MKTFNIGDIVKTPSGRAKIIAISSDRRTATVEFLDSLGTERFNITTLNKE